MFPNWKAEMIRMDITCKDIADAIEKNVAWVENRLQGKATLPVDIAVKIKNIFFSTLSYEYLFSFDPIQPNREEQKGA